MHGKIPIVFIKYISETKKSTTQQSEALEEAADFHQDHGHAERGPGQPVFGREHPHEEEEQPGAVQRDI